MTQIRYASSLFPDSSVPDLLATAFLSKELLPVDHVDFFESLPDLNPDTDFSLISKKYNTKMSYSPVSMVSPCEIHEEKKYLRSLSVQTSSEPGSGLWNAESLARHQRFAKAQTEKQFDLSQKDDLRFYTATKTPGEFDTWTISFQEFDEDFDLSLGPVGIAGNKYHEVATDGEDSKVLWMSRNNCRALYNLNVLAMHDPGHALFLQRNPTTGNITVNDPNSSSLQALEEVFKQNLTEKYKENAERYPQYQFPYDNDLDPGGWCQTWSLFEVECYLMGCSWMHDSLVNYFYDFYEATENSRVFEEAPLFVRDFIARFRRFESPADDPGMGFALSEFVRRLAVRYIHFFSGTRKPVKPDHFELATTRPTRDVARYSRTGGVLWRGPGTPLGPWDQLSVRLHQFKSEIQILPRDPREAGFQRIMQRYLADGRDRYSTPFIDLSL